MMTPLTQQKLAALPNPATNYAFNITVSQQLKLDCSVNRWLQTIYMVRPVIQESFIFLKVINNVCS